MLSTLIKLLDYFGHPYDLFYHDSRKDRSFYYYKQFHSFSILYYSSYRFSPFPRDLRNSNTDPCGIACALSIQGTDCLHLFSMTLTNQEGICGAKSLQQEGGGGEKLEHKEKVVIKKRQTFEGLEKEKSTLVARKLNANFTHKLQN